MTQRCRRCHEDLPVDSFYADHVRDGFQRYCKRCLASYKLEWDEKRRVEKARLTEPTFVGAEARPPAKQTFTLTKQADRALLYRSLVDKQGGRCPICRDDLGVKPVFDRATDGTVRGLLCPPCRLGLEGFGADSGRLRRAIKYLENR